jgi:hypothetical protein
MANVKQIRVRIKTETTGQAFGTVGVLYRGRVRLESTDVYPLGNHEAARSAAEQLAARRGYVVAR